MAAAAGASGSGMAQKSWELANNMQEAQSIDEIYNNHYFRYCKISALALLKMVMHARSGGNLEVMGLMLGKVDGETMIIMDSFALPVEGTETRVNAQAAAYEYMAAYIENAKQVGRLENAIGWYHSHPGYGCWLSGIDVSTQMLNQQFQEPFVAVVIDPTRTISAGKVNLGAFRTYPKGFKPPDEGPSEYQTIPLNKIEDFGVHCKHQEEASQSQPLGLGSEEPAEEPVPVTLNTAPSAQTSERLQSLRKKPRKSKEEMVKAVMNLYSTENKKLQDCRDKETMKKEQAAKIKEKAAKRKELTTKRSTDRQG